jgi:hypothetical protein
MFLYIYTHTYILTQSANGTFLSKSFAQDIQTHLVVPLPWKTDSNLTITPERGFVSEKFLQYGGTVDFFESSDADEDVSLDDDSEDLDYESNSDDDDDDDDEDSGSSVGTSTAEGDGEATMADMGGASDVEEGY